MLPIAMLTGAIFHPFFGALSFLTPYLIFCMLLLSYSKLSFRDIRFSPLHFWLLTIQCLGCVVVYYTVKLYDTTLAQGMMVCMLAPTATAAVVITRMLGGNVASVTAYSLLTNIAVAIFAPVLFSLIGLQRDLSFFTSLLYVSKNVVPLLLLPFVLNLVLRKFFPALHQVLLNMQTFSFYLWAVALAIVTGNIILFILKQDNGSLWIEIMIAVGALVICISQFFFGRKIGRHYHDTVAGGQGLGQKNTILAIWMAQVYLNPIASIGPGAYVLWQNMVNSYQLWRAERRK